MNKFVNNILLAGGNFMTKLYSACGPFIEHCERIKKFRETDDLNHIYKKELDQACCLLMMWHILIVRTYLKELFRTRF